MRQPKMENRSGGAGSEEMSCETRRQILEAARSRFLHYGYKKTTIDEIAADAKVGKGTVYLHFDSKEELMLTIATEVKRNITEQMNCIAGKISSPEEKIREMLLAAISSVHSAVHTAAHGKELVGDMIEPKIKQCGQVEREKQLVLLGKVLQEGVRRGEFELIHNDSDAAARHLMMSMVSFFPPYFSPCHDDSACRFELERRVNAHLDFLFHGIRKTIR